MFQPKLNVLDDESLLLDRPLEGGNLGYRILKAMQLKYDMLVDEVQTLAAVHAHNLALVSSSFFFNLQVCCWSIFCIDPFHDVFF